MREELIGPVLYLAQLQARLLRRKRRRCGRDGVSEVDVVVLKSRDEAAKVA